MKVIIRTIWVLLVMAMTGSVAIAETDPAHREAKAVEVLKQMDAYTDSMQKFVIKAESYNDASIGAGLVISNPFKSRVAVDRSGSMHSISKSGSQTSEIYLHKGELTVFSNEHKYYTRADVPKTLTEGLIYALEEFDVETPILDLLIVNALDHFVSDRADFFYVTGDSSIRGVDCHHVLIAGPNADLQLWIEKGDKPVPRRTLMTYKDAEGVPRHEVFLDWSEKDGFDASEFEFEPPEGAHEIDFIKAP
jgi:hypothetical protein